MQAALTRHHIGQRLSQSVCHGGLIFLAGQCGTAGHSMAQQTQQSLDRIDALLDEVSTSKSRILQAMIWLEDMADFDEMNAVWDAWLPTVSSPARACGEAKLAGNGYTVEIVVIAAA